MTQELAIEIGPDAIVVERTDNRELNDRVAQSISGMIKPEDQENLKKFMEMGGTSKTIFGRNYCG